MSQTNRLRQIRSECIIFAGFIREPINPATPRSPSAFVPGGGFIKFTVSRSEHGQSNAHRLV